MQKEDAYSTTIVSKEAHEIITILPEMLLIDVRTPAEFETMHIPGSHNIPLDQLPLYKDEIAITAGDTPLLLLCQSGTRARQAAEILQDTNLNSITVLEGGITSWEKTGKPFNRGTLKAPKWTLERQVRGLAGSLVLLGALGGLFAWKPLTWISALVGGGLAYSAATNTCGMAMLLSKLPYNRGASCDVRGTLKAIASSAL